MTELKLKINQAALILEASEEGEITVNIAFPEESSETGDVTAALCQAIAQKLTTDEQFQDDILSELQKNGGEGRGE